MKLRRLRLAYGALLVVALTVFVSVCQSLWTLQMGDATAEARTDQMKPETFVPRGNQSQPPSSAPEGMVWIPDGTYWMGCEKCGMRDALPVHQVEVGGQTVTHGSGVRVRGTWRTRPETLRLGR